jgi:hypothetical protein
MSANNVQMGGDHYQSKDAAIGKCPNCGGPIQHWDWAMSLRGLEYAATKYLGRWWLKDGLNSLKKVMHYTQKLIETHFPGTKVTLSFDDHAYDDPPVSISQCEEELCGICTKPISQCDCARTGRR